MTQGFLSKNPSVLWFLAILGLFTVVVTVLAEATGIGLLSTSFIKTLGKTLCLCLIAVAMDVVWGYCGILSLGLIVVLFNLALKFDPTRFDTEAFMAGNGTYLIVGMTGFCLLVFAWIWAAVSSFLIANESKTSN